MSTQKPYMNVYCSFIYNCQKAGNDPKVVQWMNGKIIVYIYTIANIVHMYMYEQNTTQQYTE